MIILMKPVRGQGQVGWYTVRISDPASAAEIAAAIDEEFANSPQETKTEPEGAFIQGFANQIGNIAFIIISIMFGGVFHHPAGGRQYDGLHGA